VAELGVVDMVGRLLLAALFGAVIGAERELSGQDAGLRTHLMLALGAGLFGLISVGAWDHFAAERADTNFQVDVTRVASYVAAGVGFLGGGTILKQAGGVRGLTTAASLWVAAAIGLAAGVGFWIPALTATATALLSLVALRPLRQLVRRLGEGHTGNIVIRLHDADGLGEVVRAVHEDVGNAPQQVRAGPSVTGTGYEVVLDYSPADPVMLGRTAERISRLDDVADVRVGR
jgi:putative Mg2+ transporter-C (MgtC) family protein